MKKLRRLIQWSALAATAVAGIHLASALTLDRRIQYMEMEYRSEKIPPGLDGYRLAFLTDIHGDSHGTLEDVAREVRDRGVDLVLLGGDFGPLNLPECMDIIAGIEPADGIYGVPGNHDNTVRLRIAMESRGMTLLENRGIPIREGLYLAGVEDLRRGRPRVEAALDGSDPAREFVLLLSHNPDVTMLQDVSRVDLTLCGHTHGGEITIFGAWSPVMYQVSRYGHRFKSSWGRSAADTDVLVSNGVGSHSPLRVFARPQVIFLTLRAAQ